VEYDSSLRIDTVDTMLLLNAIENIPSRLNTPVEQQEAERIFLELHSFLWETLGISCSVMQYANQFTVIVLVLGELLGLMKMYNQ